MCVNEDGMRSLKRLLKQEEVCCAGEAIGIVAKEVPLKRR
jgi:hypothetical protein